MKLAASASGNASPVARIAPDDFGKLSSASSAADAYRLSPAMRSNANAPVAPAVATGSADAATTRAAIAPVRHPRHAVLAIIATSRKNRNRQGYQANSRRRARAVVHSMS